MLTVAGTEINGRGCLPATQTPQQVRESEITLLLYYKPHRKDHAADAAVHLQTALWPVQKVVVQTERDRMHRAL